MTVREGLYFIMSDGLISKRLAYLQAKMNKETDPREKIKILGEVTDIVNATIRKNRKDLEFLANVEKELHKLYSQSK